MKLITFILHFASLSGAVAVEKRQSLGTLLGGLTSALFPATQPAKVQTLTPQFKETAKRSRLLWGPYDFKPASNVTPSAAMMEMGAQMDPNGQINMGRLGGFCEDCTVIHGTAFVANANGERIGIKGGAYLHHLLILNPTKNFDKFYSCAEKKGSPLVPQTPATYFLGSGVDAVDYFYTTPDIKYNSGYYIGKDQMFIMQSEVVNYSLESQKWYIAADYEYVPGKLENAEDVAITLLSVNSCMGFANSRYRPPNGEAQFNKTSPDFVLTEDGTIVNSVGHLHDGGRNIQFRINDKIVCESKASYGGSEGTFTNEKGESMETISKMSACYDPISVKKGDVMSVTAIYDTDQHELRHSPNGEPMEEMGIYGIFFAPKRTNSTANSKI